MKTPLAAIYWRNHEASVNKRMIIGRLRKPIPRTKVAHGAGKRMLWRGLWKFCKSVENSR